MSRRPDRFAAAASHGALAALVALTCLLAGGVAPPAHALTASVGVPRARDATAGPSTPEDEPTLAELVGQKLVVRMNGTAPSASLLGRVRRGEIGGIVLFTSINITTKRALVAAASALQAAAARGGQPPLLIMADQEGGGIRTIPWAPTVLSARAMGADGRTAVALAKGVAAGRALRSSGVNVDLAPVADVPSSRSGFMYLARRTFSRSASRTARLSVAFARGLRSKRVAATAKHFPGIGRVRLNTDRHVQAVTASRASLRTDLAPFRAAIAAHVPLIMLSNVTYTAYDRANGAGWSHAIAQTLLRDTLGFTGVSITDSLSGTAHARHVSGTSLAIKAAIAGTDLIMLTSRESATADAFDALLARAESGAIPTDTLRASYDRIIALKRSLATP